MKISSILFTSLVLASTTVAAQEKSPLKPVKKDTVKVIRKNEVGLPVKRLIIQNDTLKTDSTKTDTTGVKPIEINHDYCPLCGMG